VDDSVDIIVSGHLCLDLIPDMHTVSREALTIPGLLSDTGPIVLATGGAVSNTGLALHILGVKVGLMANVGGDLLGNVIIEAVKKHDPRLAEYITVMSDQPSSYTVALSPKNEDRTFLHCAGTNNEFKASDVDFERVARAKIFHLGYPPLMRSMFENDGAELQAIYEPAKATGVVTSLDMARPDPDGASGQVDWKVILQRALPHVDIFLPSIEEILFMLRRADYDAWGIDVLDHLTQAYLDELAAELLQMGVVVTGFKLGEMGIYLRTADSDTLRQRLSRLPLDFEAWGNVAHYQPAFATDVVGTTGAGDTAYAGLLTAMLRGMTPQETLRRACAVAACCVEAADSLSGLQTWAETESRLEAGWPTSSMKLRMNQ
jgi:sugar/nucleoside kinase (ribokinase family)